MRPGAATLGRLGADRRGCRVPFTLNSTSLTSEPVIHARCIVDKSVRAITCTRFYPGSRSRQQGSKVALPIDATNELVLVDLDVDGRPTKAVIQAEKNGYFYGLDRQSGRFIYGKSSVQRANWTKGLDPGGRPVPDILPRNQIDAWRRLLRLWVCGQRSCVVHISTGGRRTAMPKGGGVAACQAKSGSSRGTESPILPNLTEAEYGPSPRTCGAACAEEASCRMFLCVRCRSQVLVCRRCDRGQIYCAGTCAQQARRHHQSEARRRYQATPRGRAMHAERNRRYRVRQRSVTDQGPLKEHEAGLLPGVEAYGPVSERSPSRWPPGIWRCHFCRQAASTFVRLSTLRPPSSRAKNEPQRRRSPLRSVTSPIVLSSPLPRK